MRVLAAGGRPKVGRLVDVGRGWSLIGIMMAVRLVTSPTCSLVVGPGAQARMCRRREDVLRLCRLPRRLHDMKRFLAGP